MPVELPRALTTARAVREPAAVRRCRGTERWRRQWRSKSASPRLSAAAADPDRVRHAPSPLLADPAHCQRIIAEGRPANRSTLLSRGIAPKSPDRERGRDGVWQAARRQRGAMTCRAPRRARHLFRLMRLRATRIAVPPPRSTGSTTLLSSSEPPGHRRPRRRFRRRAGCRWRRHDALARELVAAARAADAFQNAVAHQRLQHRLEMARRQAMPGRERLGGNRTACGLQCHVDDGRNRKDTFAREQRHEGGKRR